MTTFILPLIVAVAYGFEGLFGFGGTVIFLGISGLFFDFRDMVQISMVISASASTVILMQTWRHFHHKHYLRVMAFSAPFVVLGTWLIGALHVMWLLKCFAVLLIAYGVQGLLAPKYTPPRSVTYFFVMLGGLIQGVFTTGGPFILMGYRRFFANKTELKATMAAFFLTANIWRMGQTMAEGTVAPEQLLSSLWLAVPVIIGVVLGHMAHVRISEKHFQRGLMISMLAVGVLLLFK